MVVRRSDARRRRLVVDPSQAVPADGVDSAPKPSTRKKKATPQPDLLAYSYAANRRNHHKTSDLIPKRILSYLLLTLVVVSALVLINYGAVNATSWEHQIGSEGIRSLSIHGQGSIASWFSSFLLIMTGLASLQIYALRQHRCDDYGGTYRLWLWMAALFLFASVNCVVNVGDVLVYSFQKLTSQSLTKGPWLLIGIKLSALTLLVARGIFEVRESRGSVAWVMLVWLGYSAAALMQLPAAQESLADVHSDMIIGNCLLVATSSLLMAHLTYARFIFLQAHGLIKLRERKVATKKKAAVTKTKTKKRTSKSTKSKTKDSESETETDSAAPKKKATKAKPAAKKSSSSKPAADSEGESKKRNSKKTIAKSKKATKKQTVTSLTDPASETSGPKESAEEKPELKINGGRDNGKKSAQEVLKELAAASRAKEQSKENYEDEYDEDDGVINMSKAQRRKARKAKRNARKRAA